MLFSHNQENEKLKLFAIFLNHAAEGNEKYASIVNDVIKETHEYASGQKSLYAINRDLMNIILLLSNIGKHYFEQLDDNPMNYNQQTYSQVLHMISPNS